MDRRTKFKQGLNTLYLPYYEALCEALPPEWQPYCSNRTFGEQTKLWKQGRVTDGPIVTHAKGGESAHNWQCASDWTIWKDDKPIWMDRADKRWKVYVNAVENVGLRSGVEFGDIDHNELFINIPWTIILQYFSREGSISAYQKIESSMVH